MALHLESLFRPATTPAIQLGLIHGFTQNTQCWGALPAELARKLSGYDAEIVAVDAPGHGYSDSKHDCVDLWQAGDLVVDAFERSAKSSLYLGYSMGGRIALHAALAHPEAVKALVLIGATAGIDNADDRAARRKADADLAERIDSEPLDQFIDRWLSNPLFAGLDAEAAASKQRLTNRPAGLSATLRNRGTGDQDPLWDRLKTITAPVLVIAGQDDSKFSAIGHRLVETLPNARFHGLPGTHAVHLEAPQQTATVIADFVVDTGLS